jgi:putative endonuclease
MTYVYLLINENNKFYVGSTKNLVERFNLHNSGKVLSTKGHSWKIVYYEAYLDEHDARVREQKLKHHANGIIQLKIRLKNSILLVNKK